MRVLIVNTLYYPDQVGGAEVSVQLLAESLVEQGHDVAVVCMTRRNTPRVEWVNGVRVYRVSLFNLYWPFDGGKKGRAVRFAWHGLEMFNPVMMFRMAKIVLEVKPEIVHTNNVHGFSTGIWPLLARQGLPIVHTIRDYALLCSRGSLYRGGTRCESRCTDCRFLCQRKRIDSQHVTTVVGVSRHVLTEHIRRDLFDGRRNESVVYNSVSSPSKAATRSAPAPASRGPVFGYIGRLVPEKGIAELIESFMQLRGRHPSATLIVAGSGPDAFVSHLRHRAGEGVTFIGHVKAESFYLDVDVVVVPSLWDEPFGRTVAEAIAFGRAVICSNRGGFGELVMGRPGCRVFDADVKGSLLEALEGAVARKDCREVDGCEQHEDMAAAFSPKSVAQRYAALYRDAIHARQAKPE
jgi:glycosyltransferase involved in cell wall biosynthesis